MYPYPFSIRAFFLVVVALAVGIGCSAVRGSESDSPEDNLSLHFKSDPNNPRIAYATAMLLGQFQYLQHPMDTEISQRFFIDNIGSVQPVRNIINGIFYIRHVHPPHTIPRA